MVKLADELREIVYLILENYRHCEKKKLESYGLLGLEEGLIALNHCVDDYRDRLEDVFEKIDKTLEEKENPKF